MTTTPLRRLRAADEHGVVQLGSSTGGGVHGAEARILALIRAAEDRSSDSEELAAHIVDGETRYHLSPSRANLLRALRLAAGATVLEVGAGCGAVSRYLGETVAVVDALEPMPSRAIVAAERCRDLRGVQVVCGELGALPDEAAYDVAVVAGGLEDVGGRDGRDHRLRFLDDLRRRLRPSGLLVLALDNRLGVQRLAGAAEDRLRMFDRRALETLFADAGWTARMLGVFPDHRFARAVLSDELLASSAADLAWTLPSFPTSASAHPSPEFADERRVWKELVAAGLGGTFPNSFLVLATPDGPGPTAEAWPADRLATFATVNRRRGYATISHVVRTPDRIVVRRSGGGHSGAPGGLVHRPTEEAAWVDGPVLIELLETTTAPEARAEVLRRWIEMVRGQSAGEEANIDLGPHNVVVAGERLVVIDEEFFARGWSADDVIARGLLSSALTLARSSRADSWPGCETCSELHAELCRLAGVPDLHARLAETTRREAELLAEVEGSSVDVKLADLDAALQASLPEPRGVGSPAFRRLEQRADELHRTVDWLHAEVARHVEEIERLRSVEAEHTALVARRGRLRRIARAALRR